VSWLEQCARRGAARAAIVTDNAIVTYGELAGRARAAAAWLQDRGVRQGDRVALLLPNGVDFAVLLHGIMRLGAVAVPLDPRLAGSELGARLDASRCALLCCDAGRERTAAALRASGGPETACYEPGAASGTVAAARIALTAPLSVVFTSGTSGAPKAVVLTTGNHLCSAIASACRLGLVPDERWLACLPFSHVGGLSILLRSAIHATTAVIQERFDPARVNAAIDRQGITVVSVVATMLQRMLDERGARPYPPWLRCVLLGGGPAPRALLDACARRALPVALTYGMTETASQIATLPPAEAWRAPGSVGRPLFGAALRIVRDGVPVGAGEVGDIEVRGAMLSPGELRDGVLVARAGDWLRTRDLGHVDADGFLYVVGRADDVIITGGENVHPREVEAVLEDHPSVAEACVFGIPDTAWGETVSACVRLRPGTAGLDADVLARHARRRLAGFKVPRRIAFVSDFPRSAAGKILRRKVREAAAPG
jgi:O-succinylbenzoic acid--CoA ligase